jgi:acetyl esterase
VPLDPRLLPVLEMLNAEEIDRTGTAAERRAKLIARRAARGTPPSVLDGPSDLDVRDVDADGVAVRIYRPTTGKLPVLLYFHGGGWWQGGLDDADASCRRRASDLGIVVISVDYRLAPEHPFPAGLDDCMTVARWVAASASELDIDPQRVALAGGSAGGNLAAALALRARDEGGPAFVAQVLEYPGMDLRMKGASVDEYGEGYGFTIADLQECVRFYVGETGDPTQPLVSPVFADLHDLPPALVTTCEYDPMRDSGEEFAEKLGQAGVRVVLRRWEGIGHGCAEMDGLLPDIAAAYRAELYAFLRDAFR